MAVNSILERDDHDTTTTTTANEDPFCCYSSGLPDYYNARMYCSIATKIDEGCIQVGNGGEDHGIKGLHDFTKLVNFQRESLNEEGTDRKLRHYYEAISKICTNKGLLDYLLETTCNCLDTIKETEHPTMCDGCCNQFVSSQIPFSILYG